MSVGPRDGVYVDCSGIDYSGQFFVPQSTDVYHVGDTIQISWFSGKKPEFGISVQIEMLLLQDTSSDSEQTIFSPTVFSYGAASGNNGTSWGYFDTCHNTKMTYDWTIPANQTVDSNTKYSFWAINTTDDTQLLRQLAVSEPFLILSAVADSSSTPPSSSSATTARSSSTNDATITSPTTSLTSTPQRGLATGEKIALGVSLSVGSIVLGLVGLWAWRRHFKARSKQNIMQGSDSSPEKHPAEIGGGHILEADSGNEIHRYLGSSQWVKSQWAHELDGNNIPHLLIPKQGL